MSQVTKVGVIKIGCIGTLPLLELLLDERADRTDIDVRVAGSGAKLGQKQCEEATNWIIQYNPDLIILIGPGQQTRGPTEARKKLSETGKPTIVISDGPTRGIVDEIEQTGLGYIIVNADSMIGARREFLDPIEMSLYNSDVIKVLAVTGVFNIIVREIDGIIKSLQAGKNVILPRLIINKEKAIEGVNFKNPYAKSKAMTAHEIARHVAELNVEACFRVKEWTKYVSLAAAGHEMMRIAAKLADEAREIEKSEDMVTRKPHLGDGSLGLKRSLIEKPQKAE